MYKVKWLTSIPFNKFNDSLWIDICTANKSNLIDVHFEENDFQLKIAEKYLNLFDQSANAGNH